MIRRLPRAVARRAVRVTRGAALTPWLRVHRPRVTAADLDTALGPESLCSVLRGPVLDALPTVRAWMASADADRARILSRAGRLCEHEFDLLGSGPKPLGAKIDWHTDFKTGRRWPGLHPALLRQSYGDGSDIKVPWELSRCQHLPLLAMAFKLTDERRYVDEVRRQMLDWSRANPVGLGVNWACTMDVAIRGVNWLAALGILADDGLDEPWMRTAAGDLLLHARFIRAHPEWTPVRGNHYLADVAGLLVVASLFAGGAEGLGLAEWAVMEMLEELPQQVRDDGVVHEASIPYHRLVTEMFVCGVQAADAVFPGRVTAEHRDRLDRALQFTADYTRPEGLAPQVGDADDGRFLPLGDYGADPRDHRHLFKQAGRPAGVPQGAADYSRGGFLTARRGDTFLLVRCGDTGMAGTGTHAHNDQLSFELAFGGQPLIADPGAYVYTASREWRNRFRGTAAHTTMSVDDAEQNPIGPSLFLLEDRAQAELVEWTVGDGVRFAGRHRGFAPVVHTRVLDLSADGTRLRVLDVAEGPGTHALGWAFTLAGGQASIHEGVAVVTFPATRMEIECSDVRFRLVEGWVSPSYGVKLPCPVLRATRTMSPGVLETTFTVRLHG